MIREGGSVAGNLVSPWLAGSKRDARSWSELKELSFPAIQKDSASTPKKNCSGKSIMYTAPGCRDADTLISIYIFLLIIFLILYLPLNQRNLLQLLSVFIGLFALCQFSFLQPS